MVIIATLVVTLAAVLHIVIFAMESFGWTRPAIWRRFNVADQAQAEATRPLAYNQGFYNLFLAIGALVGVVLVGIGKTGIGLTLVLFAVGSMFLASVVLVSLGARFIRPAIVQGILPLASLVLIAIAR